VPKPASNSSGSSPAPVEKPALPPFLLTAQQGEGARTLLGYVRSLPLTNPDAQLLATVVAIRAARGGIGNLTGTDLTSLRLTDARSAVDDVRSIGWQVNDALIDGDPATPVGVTVPELADETGSRLRFGKLMRSRVSGWTTRTLVAKPVRKTPPVTRLAALFLAAHGSSESPGEIPPDLPESCRAVLPELLGKGFLEMLTDDVYRLAPAVRHLSGLRPGAIADPDRAGSGSGSAQKPTPAAVWHFNAEDWAQWKDRATPALRRHVEAVEHCAVCSMSQGRVATAFVNSAPAVTVGESVRIAFDAWQEAHHDSGPPAARFAVSFRVEHGHGPSYRQLCLGMGWKLKRSLRALVMEQLIADEWLTNTDPVPWTLRPGRAAQAQGISLPRQTAAPASRPAGRV
jgi:hypothetical protein